MAKAFIWRDGGSVRSWLLAKHYDFIKSNYDELIAKMNEITSDNTIDWNTKTTQIYDYLEAKMPLFFARFYAITLFAKVIDTRITPVDKTSDQYKEFIASTKYLSSWRCGDENKLYTKFFQPNDPVIIFENCDEPLYWPYFQVYYDNMLDYFAWVKASADLDSCNYSMPDFLWASPFHSLVTFSRFPRVKAYSSTKLAPL